jgi:hypothetical protein
MRYNAESGSKDGEVKLQTYDNGVRNAGSRAATGALESEGGVEP